MPRIPRYLSNTKYFHVMTQGVNKSYILNKENDIKHYIKIMYKTKEEYSIEIVAYCIMNNHTHMLINADKVEELSQYMHRVNTIYAQYYNFKYDRVGHLFRDRFKTQEIYDNNQLLNCIKYIFENPVKAGICKQASEYPFSNFFEIGKIEEKDYDFLELYNNNDEKCKIVVENFLIKNKIDKEELIDSNFKLKKLIDLATKVYKISYAKISKELMISEYRIKKLAK